jgi:DNA-binding NarL/FixJ family response regulator
VFVMGSKVKARCVPARHHGTEASLRGRHEGPITTLDTLTSREVEVLRLIGKGLSRTEIAGELSRSSKTVDGHQERLMKKLELTTRAEVMRFAIREGFAEV